MDGKTGQLKTRFAPTPSGYVHLGNVYSFILTWLVARKNDGKILLRIDDLDKARYRLEYVEDIFITLDKLGLDYDEGPLTISEFESEYSQTKRVDLYNDNIKILESECLLFNCDCSRKSIQEQSDDGNYPGTCLEKGLPYTLNQTASRLITSEREVVFQDEGLGTRRANVAKINPYFIIRKKDGYPAYQLASLVDDLHFGINYIVRGEDLLTSTFSQLYLAKILGQQQFEQAKFHHHKLLTDKNQKLSKTQKAQPVKELIMKSDGNAKIYGGFSRWLGLSDECRSLNDLLMLFK